jgi:glucuronoarabinoxylan endo-1,4-beta-xylanase
MKKIYLFKIILLLLFNIQGISWAQDLNLISNGGFEEGEKDWTILHGNNGSSAGHSLLMGDPEKEKQFIRIKALTAGTNAWDIQLIHKGWYPMENEEYKLTFFARAENSGTKLRVVQQNTTYTAKDITLTRDWQKYEWIFNSNENFLQLKFHFPDAGVIDLDNIIITGRSLANIVIRATDTSSVDISKKYQIIEGFGSSIAFYENWITEHKSKEEIYQMVFSDLGLDWLRLRNNFKYQENFAKEGKEFYDAAKKYRGDSIRILMCSWTPPAAIKSNGHLNQGTLKKENGEYVYGKFGDYWKDALTAYGKLGIKPDMISIQNEPDYETEKWETCKFLPQETIEAAGYDKALKAVCEKIKDIPSSPKILGPEILGIGNAQFDKYAAPISGNPQLYGYAYHLYSGGDAESPDTYNSSLQSISKRFSGRPNFMTEYEHRDAPWFKTSWMINNTLTQANASGYFYWDLIWPKAGLIDLSNPWERETWPNTQGFKPSGNYYAFKHFSKYIDAGYTRIDISNSNQSIKSSAFLNKEGSSVTVVIINPTKTSISSSMDYKNKLHVKNSEVFQSTEGSFFKSLGAFKGNITLPAESVTTIVLKIALEK